MYFNIIFSSDFEVNILCIFLVHSTHDTRGTFQELTIPIFLSVCIDTARYKIIALPVANWPHCVGVGLRSSRLLGLCFRIPPGERLSFVGVVCCQV
jgi:hypothetical protein